MILNVLKELKAELDMPLYFMEVVALAKRISEKLLHVELTRLMCVQIWMRHATNASIANINRESTD